MWLYKIDSPLYENYGQLELLFLLLKNKTMIILHSTNNLELKKPKSNPHLLAAKKEDVSFEAKCISKNLICMKTELKKEKERKVNLYSNLSNHTL